jgi:hypothetical protein
VITIPSTQHITKLSHRITMSIEVLLSLVLMTNGSRKAAARDLISPVDIFKGAALLPSSPKPISGRARPARRR